MFNNCPICNGKVEENWTACAEIRGDCYQTGSVSCSTCNYDLILFDGITDGISANPILDKWNSYTKSTLLTEIGK